MKGEAAEMARLEVLISADRIAARIGELACEIAASRPERLVVISILTGSFVFAADMLRAMHAAGLEPEVDFLTLSSYGTSDASSGSIRVLRDAALDLRGRQVLLLDDILDTGRTLAFARDLLASRGVADLKICVLLDKPARRVVTVHADYVGFPCPDVFVVGYGMDLAHRYRELPYVGRITAE